MLFHFGEFLFFLPNFYIYGSCAKNFLATVAVGEHRVTEFISENRSLDKLILEDRKCDFWMITVFFFFAFTLSIQGLLLLYWTVRYDDYFGMLIKVNCESTRIEWDLLICLLDGADVFDWSLSAKNAWNFCVFRLVLLVFNHWSNILISHPMINFWCSEYFYWEPRIVFLPNLSNFSHTRDRFIILSIVPNSLCLRIFCSVVCKKFQS